MNNSKKHMLCCQGVLVFTSNKNDSPSILDNNSDNFLSCIFCIHPLPDVLLSLTAGTLSQLENRCEVGGICEKDHTFEKSVYL